MSGVTKELMAKQNTETCRNILETTMEVTIPLKKLISNLLSALKRDKIELHLSLLSKGDLLARFLFRP